MSSALEPPCLPSDESCTRCCHGFYSVRTVTSTSLCQQLLSVYTLNPHNPLQRTLIPPITPVYINEPWRTYRSININRRPYANYYSHSPRLKTSPQGLNRREDRHTKTLLFPLPSNANFDRLCKAYLGSSLKPRKSFNHLKIALVESSLTPTTSHIVTWAIETRLCFRNKIKSCWPSDQRHQGDSITHKQIGSRLIRHKIQMDWSLIILNSILD